MGGDNNIIYTRIFCARTYRSGWNWSSALDQVVRIDDLFTRRKYNVYENNYLLRACKQPILRFSRPLENTVSQTCGTRKICVQQDQFRFVSWASFNIRANWQTIFKLKEKNIMYAVS